MPDEENVVHDLLASPKTQNSHVNLEIVDEEEEDYDEENRAQQPLRTQSDRFSWIILFVWASAIFACILDLVVPELLIQFIVFWTVFAWLMYWCCTPTDPDDPQFDEVPEHELSAMAPAVELEKVEPETHDLHLAEEGAGAGNPESYEIPVTDGNLLKSPLLTLREQANAGE